MVLSILAFIIGVVMIIISVFQIIKEEKKLYISLGLGIFISALSVPFFINEIYKLGLNMKNPYTTLWEAKDVLSFYGSLLAFLGTVVLGGLALWQNERLNKLNKDLIEKQFEPILTNTFIDLDDLKESNYTWFRLIEQNSEGDMINKGYSLNFTDHVKAAIGIKNIGLGAAINISTIMHKLVSVEGLDDLDNIIKINIDDFYDKMHIENYTYWDEGKKDEREWLIYTDFNLGISTENNKINFVFGSKGLKESVHSIIEFRYEDIIGNKYRQYLYLGHIGGFKLLPMSKIYK